MRKLERSKNQRDLVRASSISSVRDEEDALRATWLPPSPHSGATGKMSEQEALVPRRKQVRDETEITAWPSSLPDDVGSITPGERDLSVDYEELGSRFLTDAVEQGSSYHPHCDEEIDEPYFDQQMGNEILRSFGLTPMHGRRSQRPKPQPVIQPLPNLAPPRLPVDLLEDFVIEESMEIDLTDLTIREASLLDHESEEAGEVESPFVRTDDVHSHGKRRGGHARTSLRPPRVSGGKR